MVYGIKEHLHALKRCLYIKTRNSKINKSNQPNAGAFRLWLLTLSMLPDTLAGNHLGYFLFIIELDVLIILNLVFEIVNVAEFWN